MNLFENMGLTDQLVHAINRQGITTPTQIQAESIPVIMEGQDVIGESATGSGKTMAFGCGIVDHVVPNGGLQALILAPTRELAEQVKGALVKLSHRKSLKIIPIYGGVAINPQMRDLTKADVVVATPGRLLDHMQRGTIDLSKVKLLILDEADRMLDMGFREDVEKIMNRCPPERQTLFFSATISTQIRELSENYMKNPVHVSATKQVDPTKLTQCYYDVQKNKKLSLLVHLLQAEKLGLVMIFCNSRRTTDFVVNNLHANRIKCIAIHGGLSQNKRSKTIEMFNAGKPGVLVCTDVAARGLHINDVSHVFNYEIPRDAKDYVHRIGRTARAGEEGKVINLLCDLDYDNFSRVLAEYREFEIPRIDLPELKRVTIMNAPFRGRDNFSRGGPRRGSNGRGPSRGPRRRWN